MQNLTQQEQELAEALFTAYEKSMQVSYLHKSQEHIKHALWITTRNRGEVQRRINEMAREARHETNPKRSVALLQPQPVATETQGLTLSGILTNQHNLNEPNERQQEQPNEQQNEVVAVAKKGRKKKD